MHRRLRPRRRLKTSFTTPFMRHSDVCLAPTYCYFWEILMRGLGRVVKYGLELTSWMHPRSCHCHLIDYIIYRSRDISDVTRTRAMRGAECSTDHRLIVSDVCWQVRPKVRKRWSHSKKLKVAAVHDSTKREKFQSKLTFALESNEELYNSIYSENQIESIWRNLTATIESVAKDTIGLKTRVHRDWFDENDSDIRARKILRTVLP